MRRQKQVMRLQKQVVGQEKQVVRQEKQVMRQQKQVMLHAPCSLLSPFRVFRVFRGLYFLAVKKFINPGTFACNESVLVI
jgi:hypothetical protein